MKKSAEGSKLFASKFLSFLHTEKPKLTKKDIALRVEIFPLGKFNLTGKHFLVCPIMKTSIFKQFSVWV